MLTWLSLFENFFSSFMDFSFMSLLTLSKHSTVVIKQFHSPKLMGLHEGSISESVLGNSHGLTCFFFSQLQIKCLERPVAILMKKTTSVVGETLTLMFTIISHLGRRKRAPVSLGESVGIYQMEIKVCQIVRPKIKTFSMLF